jgi:uncharacterized membrane protein
VRRPLSHEDRLRAGIATIAVLGMGVSVYLTAVRVAGGTPACAVTSGCAEVQESAYSEVAGVPVAALGIVAYAALLATAFLAGELGRIGGLFTGLVGAGFSGWLTYVEFGIVEAVCSWCVVSAALMGLALILIVARMFVPLSDPMVQHRSTAS